MTIKFIGTSCEHQKILLKKLHIALFAVIALSVLDFSYASEPVTPAPQPSVPYTRTTEPYSTGWGLVLDNDALISSSSDRDYTGGIAVTLGGSRIAQYRLTLNPMLSRINRLVGIDQIFGQESSDHQMRFGIILFTPEIDDTGVAPPGDRPFANLLFLENSQVRMDMRKNRVYQSTLTFGILGSGVGEAIQNAVHRVGNNSSTGEYGNQISDGGELTARYAISRQSLLFSRFSSRGNTFELKYGLEGDIGYITEGSATLAARWGRVDSPWWGFAPSRSNYLPQSIPRSRDRFGASGAGDSYFWSAITVRARAYNAFLQGQFRDSELTFSGSELKHMLGEVSIGLNRRFGNAVDVSLSLHLQTNEIKSGTGARNIRWGGLTINKSF